jgi:penicillin-binding protein 1A
MASRTGGSDRRGRKGKPIPKRKKSKNLHFHLLRRVFYWSIVLCVWATAALILTTVYLAHDLPNPEVLKDNFRAPGITIFAAGGAVIGTSGAVYADLVPLAELPPELPKAVLAAEDRRFFRHHGVDWFGVLRAAIRNVRAGRVVQGGSTITQQLAKNVFLSPERSVRRKFKELLLSLWLEHRFSKDQLLTIYLNRVYLGGGAYGVEAASKRYFGKSARNLNLAECAMIAGLLKAPSRYAPTRDLEKSQARASQVLDSMVNSGHISRATAEKARQNPAKPLGAYTGGGSVQYFVDWILDQVPSLIGEPDRDILVETTFNPVYQLAGEGALQKYFKELTDHSANQAALVVIAPDGSVRAMIGGHRYSKSQFNRAVQAYRQPGSAFKLFAYLAAFENGYSPSDRFSAGEIVINGWSPRNYDSNYTGQVTLKDGFARSVNTVAVRLAETIGREKVIEMARRLGVNTPMQPSPSLVLGTAETTLLELTVAYAAVANGGVVIWPHGIARIMDRDGKVLYERMTNMSPRKVLSSFAVKSMDGLLKAVIKEGTGVKAGLVNAAGKTGTSQGFRDAWFIGYRNGLTLGIWLGNDDASAMEKVSGGGLPAQIWREFMMGF